MNVFDRFRECYCQWLIVLSDPECFDFEAGAQLHVLFQICLVALMAVAASARPQNELPLDANGDPFDVSCTG